MYVKHLIFFHPFKIPSIHLTYLVVVLLIYTYEFKPFIVRQVGQREMANDIFPYYSGVHRVHSTQVRLTGQQSVTCELISF